MRGRRVATSDRRRWFSRGRQVCAVRQGSVLVCYQGSWRERQWRCLSGSVLVFLCFFLSVSFSLHGGDGVGGSCELLLHVMERSDGGSSWM